MTLKVRRTASVLRIDVKHPTHPLWIIGVDADPVRPEKALSVLNRMIAAWPIAPITLDQVMAA